MKKENISNLRIHIYPLKGLTDEMLLLTAHPALIVCSSREQRLKKALLAENFCAVMFQDTIEKDAVGAFKKEQADLIRNFLDSLSPEVRDLFLCCDGGDSRSPAIAAAILRAAGREEDRICDT